MVGRLSFPLVKDKDASPLAVNHSNTRGRPLTADSVRARTNSRSSNGQPMAGILSTTTSPTNSGTSSSSRFSIPLWRRRASQPISSVNTTASRDGKDVKDDGERQDTNAKAGVFHLNVDKDLPAVPTNLPGGEFTQGTSGHSPSGTGISGFVSFSFRDESSSPRKSSLSASAPSSRKSSLVPPHSQSTVALAQAALGLGLPHTMPSVASSSTGSKSPSLSSRKSSDGGKQSISAITVRRAKSFTRARSEGTLLGSEPHLSVRVSGSKNADVETISGSGRRSEDIKGKGKAIAMADTTESSPARALTKRPSFWNRRRVQSLRAPEGTALKHTISSTAFEIPVPALPSLTPISPMFPKKDADTGQTRIAELSSHQVRSQALRRRHSERSVPHSPPITPDTVHESSMPLHMLATTSRSSSPSRAETPTPAASVFPTAAQQVDSQKDISQTLEVAPDSNKAPSRITENAYVRPRSMTNPSMLLHRLSLGFFSNSSPVSPAYSPSVSTSVLDGSLHASPRNSDSLTRDSISKLHVEIPKPLVDEETPESYVRRVEQIAGKGDIASILASSADSFYARSLQSYIDRFDFTDDPLDVAVRRLLMNVGLPKETQQIDRVMEAFAARYSGCNPDIFTSRDHPYILAFSLIMLHTDAFNKSNKRKMTRADYVKNASLDGVSPLILEYFFDNIVFAPFIYIEDPVDPASQLSLRLENSPGRSRQASTNGTVTPVTTNGVGMLGKVNKIDPYFLIANNLLYPLRVDVEAFIPAHNPYTYRGTIGSWSECDLRLTFANAIIVQSDTPESRRTSALPFLSLTVGGAPGPMMSAFAGLPPVSPDCETPAPELILLKMAKFGLVNRKDDVTEGGKKAAMRKWKEVTMILTSSHLLFFRDAAIAMDFSAQTQFASSNVFAPPHTLLKPDEMLSLKDGVALFDATYRKRHHVFRFVMSSGKQILLQAKTEDELNDWLWKINYASAFQSTGVIKRSVADTPHGFHDLDASDFLNHKCVRIPMGLQESISHNDEEQNVFTTSRQSVASLGVSTDAGASLRSSMVSFDGDDSITGDTATDATAYATPLLNGTGNIWISEERRSSLDNRALQRYQLIHNKIEELDGQVSALAAQIQSNINIAKNVAILTPFQRSTRDRLTSSIVTLSKTVKQQRMEIQAVTCYRDILAASLVAEIQEREGQEIEPGGVEKLSSHLRERTLPRMTFSLYEEDTFVQGSYKSYLRMSDNGFYQTASGRASSERSSPQASSSRLNAAESRSSTQLSAGNDTGESSGYGASTSSPSVGSSHGVDVQVVTESRSDEIRPSYEGSTDTQAEDWNKTRAAKRVSLVRLPSTLAPIHLRADESLQNPTS